MTKQLPLSKEKGERLKAARDPNLRKRNSVGEELLSINDEVKLARVIRLGAQASERLIGQNITTSDRKKLTRRVIAGDKAREQMILKNTGLVVAIANKMLFDGMDLDDLISEGTIGFNESSRSF